MGLMIGLRLPAAAVGHKMFTMDPRYPVGKFEFDEHATLEKRQGWLAQLEGLPSELAAALAALPAGGLDMPYRDGGWTARQVVHHLADSHMNAYTRIKLALSEATPAIKTYEEKIWAEMPDAKSADPAISQAILDGVHRRLAIQLRALTPDEFARTATHPQLGTVTIDFLVQMYAWHSRHHVGHIRQIGR